MKRKKRNILIWVLSWAVLSLLVIYSPLGSPELYRQDNYLFYHPGVNFGEGITNAPTVHSYQQNDEPNADFPTYTQELKTIAVNTANPKSSSTSANTNYSVAATGSHPTVSTQEKSAAGAGGGFLFAGSRNAAQSKPTLQTNGITTLSTDLNSGDNSMTRQLVTDGINDGGTDPGDDPTGPPIPVGEGFPVLLLFAVIYVIYKYRRGFAKIKQRECR